ncbi:Predicted proline hydroxylase [Nocardia cyriacigeorgica]|uniref:Predicted proline hydroxylase n=1 Tax=Nocardia cyriacigeorgica TaxID=135487 RepID=A0A4U8WEU1_9NOCA|nr:Predicted proline hydroxylase [Nocardia cyriacigeorgica]
MIMPLPCERPCNKIAVFVREGVIVAGESERRAAAPQWFADLLGSRHWIRRTEPFPHVYARDVFAPEFYRRLADEFDRARREHADRFAKVADNYGASGIRLTELSNGPLAVFQSREWHDMIAGVAGVEATGDVEASLHSHPVDSPRGWPHNDLAPAWFAGAAPGPGEVRVPEPSVDTKTGPRGTDIVARETVRAVTLLFYLANEPWEPGGGGETALFSRGERGARPAKLVPPLNNSLVMFECTPRSWHAFAGANTAERNCVVMWLHRPKADVVRRWGGDRIVQW